MTKGNISKLRQTETERDKQRHSCICSKTKLVKHGTWRASFRFKLFSGDRNRGFFLRRTFGWDTALARWSALIISVLFGSIARHAPSRRSSQRRDRSWRAAEARCGAQPMRNWVAPYLRESNPDLLEEIRWNANARRCQQPPTTSQPASQPASQQASQPASQPGCSKISKSVPWGGWGWGYTAYVTLKATRP